MAVENIDELLAWEPPYRGNDIVSHGILVPGAQMIIFGAAKTWKSMMALHTSFCIAAGADWFGFKTAQAPTFRVQAELPKAVDQKRVRKYRGAEYSPATKSIFTETFVRLKIDTSYGKDELDKSLQIARGRVDPKSHLVLILDPLLELMAGHVSEEFDVGRFTGNLNDLKAKYNLSIVLIHHARLTKTTATGEVIDLGAEEVMGSSRLNNWADTIVRMKLLDPPPEGQGRRVQCSFSLARHAEIVLPSFEIQWSRRNLHPTVTKMGKMYTEEGEDEISIRDLQEDRSIG